MHQSPDAQARRILALGLLCQEQLAGPYAEATQQPNTDLCALLYARGLLSAEAAAQVRGEVDAASTTPLIRPALASRAAMSASSIAPGLTSLTAQTRILGYEVLGELGRGAMGAVLRARDPATGRFAAIKLMLEEGPDALERTRFEREAQALLELRHPHIVELLDFGEDAGHLALAMELVAGDNLKRVVDDSLRTTGAPPPSSWLIPLLADIASALAYCHERGILHRDIKPQNILVEAGTGRAVLADFGLMKRSSSGASRDESLAALTRTGEALGTPAFMAPEQFVPDLAFGPIGPPSDVWGFGATAFYAATGHIPFPGATVVEIYQAVTSFRAPPAASRNPDLPPELDDLIAACLATRAEERPTMAELAARLQGFIPRCVDEAESPSRPYRLFALLALIGGVAAALILGRSGGPQAATLQHLETLPALTTAATVQIRGKLDRGKLSFKVNDLALETDAHGRFEHPLPLKEGANELSLTFPTGPGGAPEVRRFKVTRDSIAPVIQLAPVHEQGAPGELIVGADGLVRGHIIDLAPGRFLLDGLPVTLGPDGAFEATLGALEPPRPIRIQAWDQAGNSTRRDALARPPTSARDVLMRLITDRLAWNAADPEAQDALLAEVASGLGTDYLFVGAERFSAAGASHRLGVFRHRASGVVLHLIPGGLEDALIIEGPPGLQFVVQAAAVLERGAMSALDRRFLIALSSPGQRAALAAQIGLAGAPEPSAVNELLDADPKASQQAERFLVASLRGAVQAAGRGIRRERVKIAPFLMARFELGVGECSGQETLAEEPVAAITYERAGAWLRQAGAGLRLPTEWEWRYACRAGTATANPFGDRREEAEPFCWTYENSAGQVHPRADHAERGNAFGLCDMLGNVAEWCEPHWLPRARAQDPGGLRLAAHHEGGALRCSLGGHAEWPLIFCDLSDTPRAAEARPNIGLRAAASLPWGISAR